MFMDLYLSERIAMPNWAGTRYLHFQPITRTYNTLETRTVSYSITTDKMERLIRARPTFCRLTRSRILPSKRDQYAVKRAFTCSQRWRMATSEMSSNDVAALKVKEDRLMKDIHYTCQWGPGEAWGE